MRFLLILLSILSTPVAASCVAVGEDTEKTLEYYANSFTSKCVKLVGLDSNKTYFVAEKSVIHKDDNQSGDQKTYAFKVSTKNGRFLHTELVDTQAGLFQLNGESEVILTLYTVNGASDHDYTFSVINKGSISGASVVYISVKVKKADGDA